MWVQEAPPPPLPHLHSPATPSASAFLSSDPLKAGRDTLPCQSEAARREPQAICLNECMITGSEVTPEFSSS